MKKQLMLDAAMIMFVVCFFSALAFSAQQPLSPTSYDNSVESQPSAKSPDAIRQATKAVADAVEADMVKVESMLTDDIYPGLAARPLTSCFASEASFNSCFDLTWASSSGISHATSDGAYYASKDGAWASLTGVFASPLGSDDNYVTDAEKVKLGNLSGTNTGDQDLSGYALMSTILSKTNTTAFTPTGDYHPATKKYVDDSITASGGYTDEQAQDAAGAMFTGNTETGITVTYDDATGKVNFEVTSTAMTWPAAAGVVVYGGSSAWGTSLTVGTAANNLIQLNSSAQIPAVSGALLTDSFTGTLLSGQTTHKGAIQAIATELDDAVEITAGTGITLSSGVVSVTANTYQAYDADWLGVTANGASLISAANYAAMRTLLDLEADVDFYAKASIDTQSEMETIWATNISNTIASGTASMGTSAIADGACATVVTVSATGVATTDIINMGFNGTPVGVTGYDPTGTPLNIISYPTSGNVNFLVCNSTGASVTPGALTINWRVDR